MSTYDKLLAVFGTGMAFVLVVLLSGRAHADAPDLDGETAKTWTSPYFSPKVGSLYFLGGAGFFDLDPLNDALDDTGYSKLGKPALSLGLGADISVGRLILGSEWQWLRNVGGEAERDDLRADIKSHYWLFRTGFDVVHWRGLRVYPLLGIGVGNTVIKIASEQGASFDDVLDTPRQEVRLSQRGLLLDASLGVDYRFKMRQTEYKSSFFTVGLRGGYLFAPYSGEWQTGSAEVSGGPDILTSGPTVQLLIGFSAEHFKPHPCQQKCSHR